MSYNLTNIERETQINFNEAEQTADVYTYNGALKRRLSELCESRPDEAKHYKTDQYGGMSFTVPKKWIKVNPSRILSDEEKERRTEIIRSTRERNA